MERSGPSAPASVAGQRNTRSTAKDRNVTVARVPAACRTCAMTRDERHSENEADASSPTCICLHRIFMRDDVRTGKFRSDRGITMPEVMGKPVFSRGLTDALSRPSLRCGSAPAQGWLVREERDAQVNRSPMPTGTSSSSHSWLQRRSLAADAKALDDPLIQPNVYAAGPQPMRRRHGGFVPLGCGVEQGRMGV